MGNLRVPPYFENNKMKKTLEEYMEYLEKQDEKYHWAIKDFKVNRPQRVEIHKEFPHVITYAGYYGCGSILNEMDDWCREKFGDEHGKCHWRGCEYSFNRWYDENGFEEELYKLEYKIAGPRPDRKKKRAWNKWQKITGKLIDEHFEMIEARLDTPREHSHKGVWRSFFVVKTGYDYGYQDYCFKNLEDAFYFKLMWDEENSK